MAVIDAGAVSITELNQTVRALAKQGEAEIEIRNPDARHLICVGVIGRPRIKVRGSAGYFCGGLCDGLDLEIQNNAGWGVADNLMAGTVVVGKNAGAIPGVGLRGGRLVVKGNLGSRAGAMMKDGTIIAGGKANFMAGYMMMGGRLIICDDCGAGLGQNMISGCIYAGGRIESLGDDAEYAEVGAEELEEIRQLLAEFGLKCPPAFKKIVSAGKQLHYAKQEQRLNPKKITVPEGPMWDKRLVEDIAVKADLGRYRVRSFGSSRYVPTFDDIAFRVSPEAMAGQKHALSRCNLKTVLGDKFATQPLRLDLPILIAPMSYGALSKPCKIALAKASSLAGIAINNGEGGMLPEERKAADKMIYQCLSGRYGFSPHDMLQADAVEIYISQGAKPGLGGQLMGSKVTPEIAFLRGLPQGIDIRSPSRHPDVLGADDLIIKIQEFREVTSGRVPISLKIGAGRIGNDIKIALKDTVDFIEVDGMEGGTGASSSVVTDNVGIPTLAAIVQAVDGLEEIGCAGQLQIVQMGGIRDGVDAAKAIALGAHAVAVGTATLVAMGCTGCMTCHTGRCPRGIATQTPELVAKLEIDAAADRVASFLKSMGTEMAAIALACGVSDIHGLNREHLVALSPQAAEVTGLPLAREGALSVSGDL